ncbi:MAG TPA: sigma-70 family RNA polymerase sigma factor [Candidatus Krumholzibacteria bacterium]|nr:sigma-70 family RNA polymerase sigma factor [Candidatus Krumholzibacteria bacterium]
MTQSFRDDFVELYDAHFARVYRYMDRLSGDPDLAADIAQETFIKLYQRGSIPDTPGAWLVTVAMNMFRNAHATQSRRRRLLSAVPDAAPFADRAVDSPASAQTRALEVRVRRALDRIPERERHMLLLRAEGYSYKEIAAALNIQETSIGTLLARAKRAFREHYEERADAS